MKYKTVTFDANRPIPQQITEPLNSNYGVAVKVYKDGQLVDADLSVDGKNAKELVDGWKAVELSSGTFPATKTLDVELEAAPTTQVEVTDEPFTTSGSVPFGIVTVNVYLPYFKDIPELSGLTEIKASDVKSFTASGTFTQGETATEFNKQDFKLYTDSNENYYLSPDGKGWIKSASTPPVESLVVTSDTRIRVMSIATATASFTVEGNWSLNLDSGDGFSSKFKLQVQEQDLGYIEVNDISTEPEPTPDPEKSVEP